MGRISFFGLAEAILGFKADFCRLPVRVETLNFGEFLKRRHCFFKRGFVVFDHAGTALELIHGEAGEGGACATRRQDVAGARDVITQDCR